MTGPTGRRHHGELNTYLYQQTGLTVGKTTCAHSGSSMECASTVPSMSLLPTLRTTLGVKGHRSVVDNLDCYDPMYLFRVLNLLSGRLTTRPVERPTTSKMHRGAKYGKLSETQAWKRTRAYCFAHHSGAACGWQFVSYLKNFLEIAFFSCTLYSQVKATLPSKPEV
jgi:hypothetical protein